MCSVQSPTLLIFDSALLLDAGSCWDDAAAEVDPEAFLPPVAPEEEDDEEDELDEDDDEDVEESPPPPPPPLSTCWLRLLLLLLPNLESYFLSLEGRGERSRSLFLVLLLLPL